MKKIIASIIFLIVVCIPIFAYEEFTYNPRFANNINGYLIEDTYSEDYTCWWFFTCTNTTEAWVSDWQNSTLGSYTDGKLFLTANESVDETNKTLRIVPLISNTFVHTSNQTLAEETENNSAWFVVPANKEMIISLRYRFNENTDLIINQDYSPVILVYSRTNEEEEPYLYYTYDLTSDVGSNVIENVSFTLPPIIDQMEYKFILSFAWFNGQNTTTFEIDRFKIYTLYDDKATEYWSSDLNVVRETYCGEDSKFSVVSNYANNPFANANYYNSTTGVGWIHAETLDDGYKCNIYKVGDRTIARGTDTYSGMYKVYLHYYSVYHCVYSFNDWNLYELYEYADFNALVSMQNSLYAGHHAIGQISLINKFSLLQTSFKNLENNTYAYSGYVLGGNNYTNITALTNSSLNPTTYYLFNSSNDKAYQGDYTLQTTLNLLSYANTSTPAGEFISFSNYNFRNADGIAGCSDSSYMFNVQTDYIPFFNKITYPCIPAFVCDSDTNFQYYQDINCGYNNPVWCGEWGCNAEETFCDFGVIGSVCLEDGYSYKTITENGTISYGNCYPDLCYQLTNSTIGCFSEEEYEEYLAENQPVQAFGFSIAEFLGIEMGFGLMIVAFIISFILGLIPLKADKNNTGWGLKGFAIVFLGFTGMFAIVGWIPAWYMIILILISAFVVIKFVGNPFGSGGG